MSDDSENWKQLKVLFHLAEVTPEADRERVLEENCADPAIRLRAMEIFRSASLTQDEPAWSQSFLVGRRFGPYKLIRHIGSGGIGAVYLAERMLGGSPQRSALKILAPHAAGPSFVERFHREQHILASLEHPNITRLLDAGLSESGEPYLVMEYVDGLHIATYCDEKRLSVEQRLQMFRRVCDAVAYAHRSLIVHLDLKPSNIMVTPDGTVKLLDFGTSKLILPDSMLTTTLMATPAYASPEQLRNESVTTACDIYSLGAILFELLSGRRPSSQSSMAAMIERAIREQEPDRLIDVVSAKAAKSCGLSEARLRQTLTGDLATIVAKSLSPRPGDRYASVDALSQDVQYFIEGRPILARPLTMRYRVGKFVRRHRAAVIAALLVSALILASLGYAEWWQRRAILEGRRAERMQTFMYRMFKLANSNYTGKATATVPDLLNLGVRMLPDYLKDPTDLREAQMSLAESMYENGDLDGARKVFTQAIASAKASRDINAEAESEAFSGEIAYVKGDLEAGAALTAHALALSGQRGVSPSARVWSAMYYASNRDNIGLRTEENLRLLRSAVADARAHDLPPRETAVAMYALADGLDIRGQISEAEPLFQELLLLYSQDPLALCDQARVYGELGWIRNLDSDWNKSLDYYKRALDSYSRCSGPESQGYLGVQADQLGVLAKAGRASEGIDAMERSMPARSKLGNSSQMADALYFLSIAYVEVGRYRDAERTAQQWVTMQTGKMAPTFRGFGVAHLAWARALAGEQRYREALPHAEIAANLLNNGVSQYGKKTDAEAHQFLAFLQAKLAAKELPSHSVKTRGLRPQKIIEIH
jgi:serine/threonine-protein kinase